MSFTAHVTRGLIETQREFATELEALDWVGERLGNGHPGEAGSLTVSKDIAAASAGKRGLHDHRTDQPRPAAANGRCG